LHGPTEGGALMAEGKRYQVFVSSTFLDLQAEREAVVSSLLQMEAFPAGMELFPAADDDAWTLIKRVIDESDYYLLVIGGKYGSIDPETELSYTEKEYEYAVEQGKPVMAFLHSDPDRIEFGKSEKGDAAREKLEAFRKKVEDNKHVKYWSGPEDLAGKVALSFSQFRQTYPAVGWVRGDEGTSTEALQEINELRKQLAAAEDARSKTGPPDEAAGLAQGNEVPQFQFSAKARARGSTSMALISFSKVFDLGASWNDLFSQLGPEMLNEADEGSLRKRLRSWIREQHYEVVKARLMASRLRHSETSEGVQDLVSLDLDLRDENFQTLIIQLRALGLIEKSDRQRSVKDKGAYWTLTSFGDQHLTTLRAIRRDEIHEARSDGAVADAGTAHDGRSENDIEAED
jgi:Domain of unknown function (DUF4062)